MNKINLSFIVILFCCVLLLAGSCSSQKSTKLAVSRSEKIYDETWNSLKIHNTPDWLLGMKFGIYSHWSPLTTVCAMRKEKEMSYIDAIPYFTGEKFNADEWAAMYKSAGVQFAGALGMHCSGLCHWDSDITQYDMVNYGPKKDVFGSLIKAIKKQGLKTLGSFHAMSPSSIWGRTSREDSTFREPTMFSDDLDYDDNWSWQQGWFERVQEAYNKYPLDMLWFDCSFGNTIAGELKGYIYKGKFNYNGKRTIGGISETWQKKLIADYYNYMEGRGKTGEVIYKVNDIPANVGMRDIENGNLDGLQYDPWMADINIMQHKYYPTTWFYNPKNPIKDANCIVDMLIDITSKNGRMLLNVPPQADGSFTSTIKKEMADIGAWLKVNGEGIYDTNPWAIYGEGPTDIVHPGQHGQGYEAGALMPKYTSDDIRYTCKNNTIYAFALAESKNNTVHMYALGSHQKLYPGEIKSITLLGSDATIEYKQEDTELIVTLPKDRTKEYAYCLKIVRK